MRNMEEELFIIQEEEEANAAAEPDNRSHSNVKLTIILTLANVIVCVRRALCM